MSRDECLRSEFGVRFHYFSLAETNKAVETIGPELVRRRHKDGERFESRLELLLVLALNLSLIKAKDSVNLLSS